VADEPKDKPTPSWVTEDPFPPKAPASSSKVTLDPALQAELDRAATPSTPAPAAPSTPAASTPAPPAVAPAPPPAAPPPSSPPTTTSSAPAADEPRDTTPPGRRYLGLPWWGWVLALAAGFVLLAMVFDLRNRNRFIIVCEAHKVELHQGRRLPWPFGREAVGGPEYKPIAIPAEADCRHQVFGGEEEAARAFLELLLNQVRNALVNPGASNLREARQQLQQALLLSRTHRARRKEAEGMLAELSYREGRAGLARAENELRVALTRFQEAQKLDARRFDDLDEWISHLDEILRTIAPSPFSAGAGHLGPLHPSSGPSSRPALRRRSPESRPSSSPPVAPQPTDAGPAPGGGGILM
jgi:hypothetical protein